MSELEIFELGMTLAKALGGDKEAIGDITLLYKWVMWLLKTIMEQMLFFIQIKRL